MERTKFKKRKNSIIPKAIQTRADELAKENQLKRLCPICDNLVDWFEEEECETDPEHCRHQR